MVGRCARLLMPGEVAMQAWSRRLLPVLVLAAAVGCTPAAPTPSPLPSFRCTPEAGGAEFDCSQAQYDEMVAKDALYAEAEAVYRKFLAEDTRIMRAGGVAEPTDVILETTSGAFLEDVMSQYREFEQEGLKAEGSGPDLISVKRAAGRSKTGSIVSITTCVDGRSTDFIKQGKPIGSGVLARDDNYFARVDGLLKVVGADGKEVESC